MAQVTVTTSPTTLDSGSSGFVALKNLGQVPVRVVNAGNPTAVLMPSCTMTVSPGGAAVTGTAASGTCLVDVAGHPAPDVLQGRGPSGVQSRISGSGALVTKAAAPQLADLAPGEVALAVDGQGNLKVWSNVAGVLKSGTVTVS